MHAHILSSTSLLGLSVLESAKVYWAIISNFHKNSQLKIIRLMSYIFLSECSHFLFSKKDEDI